MSLPLATIIEAARQNVRDWLPAENNLKRIRYADGAQNMHGEYEGRSEDEIELRAVVTRVKDTKAARSAGDAKLGEYQAAYLSEDDHLEVNDRVVWRDRYFEVIEVSRPELEGEVAFCRAQLRERK